MNFRDELDELPKEQSAWKMDFILRQLPADEAKELREILADESVKSVNIARVLKKRNLFISERAVQRYRSENVFSA